MIFNPWILDHWYLIPVAILIGAIVGYVLARRRR